LLSDPGEAVIGVLHISGAFEAINASQVASVSVGLHPKIQQQLASGMSGSGEGLALKGKKHRDWRRVFSVNKEFSDTQPSSLSWRPCVLRLDSDKN
jgi:hypothetical protein